tara:strand:+ start:925 stop:1206 length:282 start_codon:yes stop_codon:yes gene_type:complete
MAEQLAQQPPAAQAGAQPTGDQTDANQTRLIDVDITDENVALNVMVGFLNLAQRKGAFAFDESAKIWECINRFQKQQAPAGDTENVKVEVNEK